MLMDDCVDASSGDRFYQSSYKMLKNLFGAGAVKSIPLDHEVFSNVYDLRRMGLPTLWGVNHGAKGVFINERLAVFLSSVDLHCGWGDLPGDSFGKKGTRRHGQHGYEESIQMGINIIMYSISH